MFTPSKYQQAIFDFIQSGSGNAVIEAVAGSGKTTTIVQALKLIPTDKSVVFLAFNKKIAEELKSRVPGHVQAMTLNGLGHRAWTGFAGRQVKLDGNKTREVMKEFRDDYEQNLWDALYMPVRKLVGLAKAEGIVPEDQGGLQGLVSDVQETWDALIDHHDIQFVDKSEKTSPEREGKAREAAIELARSVLTRSIELGKEVIDFDDQLYLTVIHDAPMYQYDWVFTDESQDVSAIQRALITKAVKRSGRAVFVGDPCQPTGTTVKVVTGKKSTFCPGLVVDKKIEDIKKGDLVVSFDQKARAFVMGRKVLGVTKTEYSGGDLITVTTASGLKSSYTPNHHCIANFKPFSGKYCVYLMRRGNHFRVGKCKMFYGKIGSGPLVRMSAEGAEALWILNVYENQSEAMIAEQITSANFGITQLTFNCPNGTNAVFTQDILDYSWRSIFINNEQARKCLISFGRDINHPVLWNGAKNTNSLLRPMVIKACNLISGCLVLPFDNEKARKSRKDRWVPVVIGRTKSVSDVYSLTIEKDQTYIGDGIVTHNCQAIYGFRGADSESMENIAKQFNCTRLPLSVSYRCPRNIVAEAQAYVSHILPHESAPEGEIKDLGEYNDKTEFATGSLVVCRSNAPLIRLAYKLIRRRVGVKVMGRDIGAGLITLIEKLNAKGVDKLVEKVNEWHSREASRRLKKDPEADLSDIDDKRDVIEIFATEAGAVTVPGVISAIENLFADKSSDAKAIDPKVMNLATIHKSKGLEAETVYFLDSWMLPSKYAKKPHQQIQESNLSYVAITRAKQKLVYIDSPKPAPRERV